MMQTQNQKLISLLIRTSQIDLWVTGNEKLDDFHHRAVKWAKDEFAKGVEEVPPTWLIQYRDPRKPYTEVVLIRTPWTDTDGKQFSCFMISDFMRKLKADRYAIVSEAWARRLPAKGSEKEVERIEREGLDRNPEGRYEVLIIQSEDKEGEQRGNCFKITRNRWKLSLEDEGKGFAHKYNRFADLLREPQ